MMGDSIGTDWDVCSARVVRELTGYAGRACLVEAGGRFFVVSSIDAPFSGPETLAFPANADGEVTDWCEVAGGRGVSREEAIRELALLFGGEGA